VAQAQVPDNIAIVKNVATNQIIAEAEK